MRPDRRALLGGLALSPLAASAACARQVDATPDAALDAVYAAASPMVPALAGMIVSRDGVEWIGVRGLRRAGTETAVTAADRWHLGSNTKAMTAALFARRVEAGQARWGMPLAEAFPAIAVDAGWGDTTLDDLMHHRAGLLDASVIGQSWLMTARDDPRSLVEQRAAIAEAAFTRPPAGPRGAFAYGNANYIVLGSALETLTGRSWEDQMRQDLFGPLGMASGGFGPPSDPNAWGHRVAPDGARLPMPPHNPGSDNPLALGPAGTAHVALADYARFLAVFFGDGDWLGPDSLARLTTPADGAGAPYADGWAVRRQPWGGRDGPGPVLGHEGTNTMWHCFAAVAPERGLAFVATANDYAAGQGACQQLAIRLMALRTAA